VNTDLGTLGPLEWWDIGQVAELELLLFPTDSPWTAGMFWSELSAGYHYVAIKDSSGRVLGYAGLSRLGPDEAEVQTIGVHPDEQGKGLGRHLLRNLIAGAGDRAIYLDVRTDNAAAVSLYTSEGFTTIGLRRHYYQPSGADAFTMLRQVPSERIRLSPSRAPKSTSEMR
jgi:[ribosomal protein S18]-alanine N-acetyltransferase